MKYIAFLDILGFKSKMKSLNHNEIKDYIGNFSSTIYNIFKDYKDSSINGYIVSDSIILYTNNDDLCALYNILELVDIICRNEFRNNGILIRGGLAKGDFDDMPATELPKLSKKLIVGDGYVEAYNLENSLKIAGINLSNSVYEDIQSYSINTNVDEETIRNEKKYIYKYLTLDFLLCEEYLNIFVNMANKAKWLPHYYNTLYFAMKNENRDKMVKQLFINIQNLVCEKKPNENWRKLDIYIENSFNEEVIANYQKRFLKYIRNNFFHKNNNY